jgi:hypothetical protein
MSSLVGLVEFFKELTGYLKGKGEIYRASNVALLYVLSDIVRELYGIDISYINYYANKYIELSEIQVSRFETVAQKNVKALTLGLKEQIQITESAPEKYKIVDLSKLRGKSKE